MERKAAEQCLEWVLTQYLKGMGSQDNNLGCDSMFLEILRYQFAAMSRICDSMFLDVGLCNLRFGSIISDDTHNAVIHLCLHIMYVVLCTFDRRLEGAVPCAAQA